ncbi:hypothetical protein [Paenarthrobacter nicotinovorans]|uniref:hypothetical protein n=1 Tax=Paenarthrobacter nicotinovorans TaxID=29320 RepID=UPI0006876B10|nr:hypothetical protein [Paenarthrobacter nicotinovorans]
MVNNVRVLIIIEPRRAAWPRKLPSTGHRCDQCGLQAADALQRILDLGGKLHVVERQAESELKKFREYIENQEPESEAGAAPAGATPAAEAARERAASEPGAPPTGAAPAAEAAREAPEVDPITHPFDQTNGLADVDGDSDGTAESDTRSAAERNDDDHGPGLGFIPPQSGGLPGQR